MAVLETARGGIVLRGVGYESNDASVLTNVSSDHLDLQGIHTLPELAEVKATICRITRPDGWVVLNADDPLVAAVAATRAGAGRAVLARRGRLAGRPPSPRPAAVAPTSSGAAALVEVEAGSARPIVTVADIPITIGGIARHNVANALAAAGGARALGATIEQVADGLRDFRPTADRSPGSAEPVPARQPGGDRRLRAQRGGDRGRPRRGRGDRRRRRGRAAPITVIIGTAGDRPDDTLRGIGRIAAERAQRVAIKETQAYLRGRTRESVVGELLAGVEAGGWSADEVPVYASETAALRAELNGAGAQAEARGARPDAAAGDRADVPRGARPGVRAARRARRPADRRVGRADGAGAAPPGPPAAVGPRVWPPTSRISPRRGRSPGRRDRTSPGSTSTG